MPRAERLQETDKKFDVIITCDERVFDQTIEAFEERESESMEPVHIINIDIRDNHDDATIGSFHIFHLCQMVWANGSAFY
jgi:RNA polymerase II subunit A C-terminal domain phosphatase SSU72